MAAFLLLQDRRFYKWVHKLKKWGMRGGQSEENQKKRYGRLRVRIWKDSLRV